MPRIQIELTSTQSDGTWTWRVAGARQPRGVLPGELLPTGTKVGDVLRVDADVELEGTTVTAVVAEPPKRQAPERLQLLGTPQPFEAVTTSLVPKGARPRRSTWDGGGESRGSRSGPGLGRPGGSGGGRPGGGPGGAGRPGERGDDARRGPRQSGPRREADPAPADAEAGLPGDDRPRTGAPPGSRERRPTGEGGPRSGADRRPGDGPPRSGPDRRPGDRRPTGPGPSGRGQAARAPAGRVASDRNERETTGAPRPKRLNPGNVHRAAVLADLAPEHVPVAEQLLHGGIPAVRRALQDHNAKLRTEGQPEIKADAILMLAEELLPRLKAAEWRDRAEAAVADIEDLALRDLRSVVAGGDAARDDDTRLLARTLRDALDRRETKERQDWVDEIGRCLDDGRLVRALRVSGRPPDPRTRVPAELAARLSDAAGAGLAADALPDRWITVLEAVIDSPIHRSVKPAGLPTDPAGTVLTAARQASGRVPALAAMLGIDMPPPPGPLRGGLRPGRPGAHRTSRRPPSVGAPGAPSARPIPPPPSSTPRPPATTPTAIGRSPAGDAPSPPPTVAPAAPAVATEPPPPASPPTEPPPAPTEPPPAPTEPPPAPTEPPPAPTEPPPPASPPTVVEVPADEPPPTITARLSAPSDDASVAAAAAAPDDRADHAASPDLEGVAES